MTRAKLFLVVMTISLFAAASMWSTGSDEIVRVQNSLPGIDNLQGVGECQICHSGNDLRGYTDKNGRIKSDEFVKLDESKTWEFHDPHSRAFAVLNGKLGREMNARMAKLRNDPNYEIRKAAECLTCHASDQDRLKPLREKKIESFILGDVNGVNCTYCHTQPDATTENKTKWIDAHWKLDSGTVKWRTDSVENKSKAGLANLRDPHIKANLCVSCHVGNPAEGKVVTHEMYAAGHPPLPPFEQLTFMEDEPRHWGTPAELKFFDSIDENTAKTVFSYHKKDGAAGYAARHFAAGVIASLRAEASLLAFEAKSIKPHAGLDFARFDCYACHHDLKLPSDRQERGYEGPPGRPPVKAWVGVLAEVVAKHAGENHGNQFTKLWNELKVELYSKPYGNPVTVGPKAEQVIAWCDQFAKEIEQSNVFDKAGAQKLHTAIANQAIAKAHDPEATMALVWAYRSLGKSLGTDVQLDGLKKVLPLTVREVKSKKNGGKEVPNTVGEFTNDRMKLFINYNSIDFLKGFPPAKK